MINQKVLSDIKVTELDADHFYIFTYDEKEMEENEMSGYKALNELCQAIHSNFPNLWFIIGPDYKLNVKESYDKDQLKALRDLIDEWLYEDKNSESK